MWSCKQIGSDFDPFASKKLIHVSNISSYTMYTDVQTKIPKPSPVKELCISHYHETFNCDVQNSSFAESDHFQRHFREITLPQPIKNFSFSNHSHSSNQLQPFHSCEIPSSNMKPSNKIFFEQCINPSLTSKNPLCSICHCELEYPFLSSLKYFLCKQCFSEKLPLYTSSFDYFVQIPPQKSDGDWTLAETNKLLSLFEELGDNWIVISQKMNTRTPEECLIQFVRIPMYDYYYISDPISVPEFDALQLLVPFMCAPQPIAALIEFLKTIDVEMGLAVTDIAQKLIERAIVASSSTVSVTQVSEDMRELLLTAAAVSRDRADSEYRVLIDQLQKVCRSVADQRDRCFLIIVNDTLVNP